MRVETPVAEAMPWGRFEPWFKKEWQQGEHVAVVGPTGFGKTTVVVNLLQMRRHALALDVKGGDKTLAKLQAKGFARVSWPLEGSNARRVYGKGENGQFIVGHRPRDVEGLPALRATIARCLHDVFSEGGWTVYVDELQMAASPKREMMNLGGIIELNLIAARDRGVSILTSFQAPRWVPRAASDQASWLFVFPTRDREVVDRLAEMAGRPREEVQGAIRGLGKKADHMVLVVGTDPFAPMIVTRAPKI